MKRKRNRIVIDLNQPQADPRAARSGRSRASKVLLIAGIVLVAIVIGIATGAYFWWQSYKAGPSYTLALLVDAAQRNDHQEIDRILDMDKIAETFVGDVRSRLTGSSILNSLLPAQVDQLVATITPKLKQTLREVLPGEIQRVSAPAKGKPFILIALGVPYLVNVKQDGATATFDLKFNDEQIQVTMQQAENSWRIVSIKDDRLANIIADAARKGVSERGSGLQDEIQRRLKDWKMPTPSP